MRFVSATEVRAALEAVADPEPRVVVSGNFATPRELLGLLERARERYRLFVLNAQGEFPLRRGVVCETPFIGPGVRGSEYLHYIPARLSLVPRLFERHFEPDVVLVHTSTPRDGRVSLGIEVNILPAAIERVRQRGGLVIAQVNPHMPYTHGDAVLDESMVDLGFEHEVALESPSASVPDELSRAIGAHAAAYVVDGATLQLGIGDVPDAALGELLGYRELGVWSELISDGVLHLERRAALRRDEPVVCSFLYGSEELYRWADGNDRLLMRRTEIVNNPARISARPAMFSLNAALQLDLFAQANATHVRGTIYSGFGGQPDFVVGALHSPGGHAMIAVRGWHDKTNASCVVPLLEAPVCTFQHSVIVSEHGSAEIFGRSQAEQMHEIIERVADPRTREALREHRPHRT